MTGPDPRTVSLEAADKYVVAAERLAEAARPIPDLIDKAMHGGFGDGVALSGGVAGLERALAAFDAAKKAAK